MKARPVIPRVQARRDVEEAVARFLAEDAAAAASSFIDALQGAYAHISLHPASGSPRYAHELGLPGLLCWRTKRHPYVIFYVVLPDHIDVWRVLHARRDIPAGMQGLDGA